MKLQSSENHIGGDDVIKVMYFAYLKDITGVKEEWLEIDGNLVRNVLNKIFEKYPKLKDAPIMVVVDKKIVKEDEVVEEGDEIRVYPPVCGG
ncbi:molybdopterin synthase sulfur carrier subunit [Methanosarcinales archaeon]|nr:MAG: molybdopterin synthase sulfur carrier subunit [Thermoplasmata archaeon]RLG21327.1 MAG: molybdopterin synthase sulfur carrier subunit [Methanosarcinales archaeon]